LTFLGEETISPDPLKPGPKSVPSPYLNYYIMQSTGHETQATKPGHNPLITLPKELLPFLRALLPKTKPLQFVELILPSFAGAKAPHLLY